MPTDRVRISRRGWFLVVAVIIALLPFVIQDSYWRTNLIVCAINIMLAIGLDFILGYAGQLNLGHSAFYGIGAYASTLLVMKLGVPFWMAFVFGMVLSGAAGMALSIFAVRLRGHYLAIASLAFAVIVHQVLLNWISLTQGPLGIYAIKPPPDIPLPGLPVISFGNTANMFYLVASFAPRPSQPTDWSIQVGMSMPIFFWLKQNEDIERARHDLAAARDDMGSLRSQTAAAVTSLYRSAEYQYQTAALYRDSLTPLARQNFQVALIAYQSGKIDFTTLAAALQREYGARISYLQAANQFLAGRVAIEQTIGMPLPQ